MSLGVTVSEQTCEEGGREVDAPNPVAALHLAVHATGHIARYAWKTTQPLRQLNLLEWVGSWNGHETYLCALCESLSSSIAE